MPEGSEAENFDHSGEVLSHMIASELYKYQDQPLTSKRIECMRDQLAGIIGLMGVGEASEALEISKQRIHQLEGQAMTPPPIARLAMGPVWLKRDIETFKAERKPITDKFGKK